MKNQDFVQIIDNLLPAGEVSNPSQDGWYAFSFPWQKQEGIILPPYLFFASFYGSEQWIHDEALEEQASAFLQAEEAWKKDGCGAGVYFGQSYRHQ